MFELTIKCSKDIKRLTLDFEDSSSVSSTDIELLSEESSLSKSNDFMDRFANIKSPSVDKTSKEATKSEVVATQIPSVKDRPPLVDDGFNESL